MIDWAIVIAFVAYSVWVGIRSREQSAESLTEYFLAGRQLKGWRSGLSMAATQFAADTPLLVMGLLAVGGAFSLWRLWIYGLAFLLMGFILSAAWRRANVLTDAELTMVRYSNEGALALRTLKGIYYGTIINCVGIAMVLIAAVRVFEVFLPWHLWINDALYTRLLAVVTAVGVNLSLGVAGLDPGIATTNSVISIALMLSFVGFYSTAGGLRSVISTDVAQLAIMLGGTAAYTWFAVDAAGGLGTLPQELSSLYGENVAERFLSFSPRIEDAWIPFVVIISLQWFFQISSDGTGYLAQRTMACADDREARIASVVFTLTQIVVRSLMWLLIGLSLLIVFPFDASGPISDAVIGSRELTFVMGIDELLPAGVRGLMLTGMLAALASTVSTHLNWGASYWSNDLYAGLWVEKVQKRKASQKELVRVAKISNVIIIAIALVVMANLGSIQQAWLITLLFGAGTGAVLVLRWLWERVNLHCETVSLVVAIVAAPLLLIYVDQEWVRLAAMAGVSTLAVILSALLLPMTDQKKLTEFYQRTRPPGWWRVTAAAIGEPTNASLERLRNGAASMATCAVSTFCWLVGFGKLLLQPDSTIVAIGLILAGGIAAPHWLRKLRRPGPK